MTVQPTPIDYRPDNTTKWEKITVKANKNGILFEDWDKDGKVIGAIGFQVVDGRFTVYIKGYEIDAKKFPALKGYHGYTLTDNEIDELLKFADSLESKIKIPKRPRRP